MNDRDRYGKTAIWVMWLCVIAMTAIALVSRSSGLNPSSLFIDDLWQGLLSSVSLMDQFRFRSSAPIGFTAMLGAGLRLIPDPEFGLQLAPFLAGLMLTPVMALVVFRLTKNPPAAVLAAAMVTCAPQVAALSVRVKQYTLDALLVAVLLLLGVFVCEQKKLFTRFIVIALTFLLLSFSSIVVAVLLVGAFAVAQAGLSDGWRKNRRIWMNTAIFFILTGLFYMLVLDGQKNIALDRFWSDHFPETCPELFSGLFSHVQALVPQPPGFSSQGADIIRRSFSYVYVVLAVIGAVILVRKPGFRWFGFGLVMVYPALAMMALLHLYPLGGGRTDLFIYPVTVLFISSGLAGLFERTQKNGLRTDRLMIVCGIIVMVFCLPLFTGKKLSYPSGGKLPEVVSQARAALRSNDGLLVFPHCSFCFAYYSNWPFYLEPCDFYATGFNPVIERPNVHVLPGLTGYGLRPQLLAPEIEDVISHGYAGLVFFTMDIPPGHYIDRYLTQAGYRRIRKIEDQAVAYAIVYRRKSEPG